MIPSLSICVNNVCNLKCTYCHKDRAPTAIGENPLPTTGRLSDASFSDLVRCASDLGITVFRLTGGEPLATPKRLFALLDAVFSGSPTRVLLNTNGTLLTERHADALANYSGLRLKISLDSLDKHRFEELCGRDRVSDVVRAVELARERGIPVEINCVVTQANASGVAEVWRFCVRHGANLKLLDLYERETAYWRNQYQNMDTVLQSLEGMVSPLGTARLSSGRGIPMRVFRDAMDPSSHCTLTVKDMTAGTTYLERCRVCPKFPCGEGMYTLLLDEDGRVFWCHKVPDVATDYDGDAVAFRSQLEGVLRRYDSSAFSVEEWCP